MIDPVIKDTILWILRTFLPIALTNLGRLLPGFLTKLRLTSEAFADVAAAYDDGTVTNEEFDHIYEAFRKIALDPPGQKTSPSLWEALKGPAFKFAFALLGIAVALLVGAEIVFRVL